MEKTVVSMEDIKKASAPSELPFVLNSDGSVKNRLENYTTILRNHPSFVGKFKYNLMDGRIYADGLPWNIGCHPLNDFDVAKILEFLAIGYGLDNQDRLYTAIKATAWDNQFHPIRDMLAGLHGTWDGVERLSELFPRYLGAERSDYTTAITKLLFAGAIQRVMNPGCKFDYCVVIKGKQGTGKSSLIKILALDDKFFTDQLKDMEKSKEAFEQIQGRWVVELGEMLFVKKTSTIEAIKSYITRTSDSYRVPYDRNSMDYERQCVFVGTTNKTEFLPDDKTGNRRFVPLICDGKPEKHPLDDEVETREFIRQCYAEALAIGERDGYKLVLDKEYQDIATELNENATPEDYRVGMIQEWLNDYDGDFVCTSLVWNELFGDPDNPIKVPRYEASDIADILDNKVAGWSRYDSTKQGKHRFQKYGVQRAWKRDRDFVRVKESDAVPFDVS